MIAYQNLIKINNILKKIEANTQEQIYKSFFYFFLNISLST